MYEIFFLPHLWSELQSICHPGPLTLTWVLPHDSGRVNWPPVFCEQSKNRPFQLLQIWCLVHLCSIYFALGDSQIAKCMEKKSIQLQCWLICIQSRKCLKRCKPIYMSMGAGSVFCPCLYCKLNRSIVPNPTLSSRGKGKLRPICHIVLVAPCILLLRRVYQGYDWKEHTQRQALAYIYSTKC
jgi:hypothetical protein